MAYETNALHLNKEKQQFEIEVDGDTALIAYKERGNVIYLIHTETPPELEGKGIASALTEKTLQYLDKHHLQLVPICPFVQSYLEKHPHWNRLVTEE